MYFCASSKASKPSTCELAALLYVVEEIGCAEHLAEREREYLYFCTTNAVKSTATPKSRGHWLYGTPSSALWNVSLCNVLVKQVILGGGGNLELLEADGARVFSTAAWHEAPQVSVFVLVYY